MAYISYKNLPIWLGSGINFNGVPDGTANHKEIYAQSVQLSYSPNLAPVRILGKTPTANNYNLAGPPNATLSFSCYLDPTIETTSTNEFNPLAYTGNVGDIGTTFLIGDPTNGIKGSGAFLTSLSFTSTPYQPILFQCEFAVYNPLAISSDGGRIASTSAGSFDLNKAAHGAYSNFVSTTLTNNVDLYDSFTYQYSCQRLPIYEIGGFYPKSVEFITAEHSFSLEADNIPNIVPMTGKNATVDIYVTSPAGGNNVLPPSAIYSTSLLDYTHASNIKPQVAGKILQENIGIEGGDFGRGSITITQLLR